VFSPYSSFGTIPVFAQFIVLDLKRPWYVNDLGCQWRTGKPLLLDEQELVRLHINDSIGPLKWAGCAEDQMATWSDPVAGAFKGRLRDVFIDLVAKAIEKYEIVYQYDGFMILRRQDSTS